MSKGKQLPHQVIRGGWHTLLECIDQMKDGDVFEFDPKAQVEENERVRMQE